MALITLQQFRQICPGLKFPLAEAYLPHLIFAVKEREITTPVRLAAFLGQILHESESFRFFAEIWGPTQAQKGYEPPNRKALELGNTQPGDGKRYKGRGAIQTTGRANYAAASTALGADFIAHPELLEQPEYAFRSAAWFWQAHGLNVLADVGDYRKITKIINGGYNGYSNRLIHWERAKQVLGVKSEPPAKV